MKTPKRDLLFLPKNPFSDQQSLEQEMEQLHQILYHVESFANFCVANEIINLNTYKVVRQPYLIQKLLPDVNRKPFLFVHCKN